MLSNWFCFCDSFVIEDLIRCYYKYKRNRRTLVNTYSYDIDVYDPYDYSYGYYNDDYYKNRTTIYNDDGSSQTLWPDGSMTGVTADGYRIESDPNGYFDIYDRYGNVIGGGYDEYFISNG